MERDCQLLHLAKKVKEFFRCAKCKKELEPPIAHCISGHEVCSQCRGTSCPFCSSGFAVSSRLMEQVFELLPKPCKLSDRGCTYVSVSGRHEPLCEFRTITCRVGVNNKCTWSGTVRDWMKHVDSEHQDEIFHVKDSEVKQPVNFFNDQNLNNYCLYLPLKGKIFLFFMVKIGGEVLYAVRYVPIEPIKYGYYLTVACRGCGILVHMCAVGVKVLEECELAEDMCKSFGVFIEELESYGYNKLEMRFSLKERKLI